VLALAWRLSFLVVDCALLVHQFGGSSPPVSWLARPLILLPKKPLLIPSRHSLNNSEHRVQTPSEHDPEDNFRRLPAERTLTHRVQLIASGILGIKILKRPILDGSRWRKMPEHHHEEICVQQRHRRERGGRCFAFELMIGQTHQITLAGCADAHSMSFLPQQDSVRAFPAIERHLPRQAEPPIRVPLRGFLRARPIGLGSPLTGLLHSPISFDLLAPARLTLAG
jgi:hypothetical protein